MIEISVNMKEYCVEVKGHANSAPKGEDIICAGISALFYTLYEVLYQNKEMLEKKSLKSIMVDGEGTIYCKPKKEYEGNVQMMYLTVLTGLELMAKNYPEYINMVVGRNED